MKAFHRSFQCNKHLISLIHSALCSEKVDLSKIQGKISGTKTRFSDMKSEKAEEEEDAAPQHYVASSNFIASGSDQVRETNMDDRNHNQ